VAAEEVELELAIFIGSENILAAIAALRDVMGQPGNNNA